MEDVVVAVLLGVGVVLVVGGVTVVVVGVEDVGGVAVVVDGGVAVPVVGRSVEDGGGVSVIVVSFENSRYGVDNVDTRQGVNSFETRDGVDSVETKLSVDDRAGSGSVGVVVICSLGVADVVGFMKVILNPDVVVDFDGNDFSVVVVVPIIVVVPRTLCVTDVVGFMKVMLKIDVAGSGAFVASVVVVEYALVVADVVDSE